MKIVRFFPQWYKENIIRREKKRLTKLVFITLFVNIFLVYLLLSDMDTINNLGKTIRKHEEDIKVSAAAKLEPKKNLQLVKTYYEVRGYNMVHVNYQTLDINYSDLTVVAVADNMKSFLDFVSNIEKEGKFSIKKIATPETTNAGIKVTLTLSKK